MNPPWTLEYFDIGRPAVKRQFFKDAATGCTRLPTPDEIGIWDYVQFLQCRLTEAIEARTPPAKQVKKS